jgi:hypothetical protein
VDEGLDHVRSVEALGARVIPKCSGVTEIAADDREARLRIVRVEEFFGKGRLALANGDAEIVSGDTVGKVGKTAPDSAPEIQPSPSARCPRLEVFELLRDELVDVIHGLDAVTDPRGPNGSSKRFGTATMAVAKETLGVAVVIALYLFGASSMRGSHLSID